MRGGFVLACGDFAVLRTLLAVEVPVKPVFFAVRVQIVSEADGRVLVALTDLLLAPGAPFCKENKAPA